MHQSSVVPSAESRPTPDEVVRQLRHLPSAPQVLPKLKKLLGDGNSSLYDVVALIRLDQGIAARVLQMGNSAYFSHGVRCYTVDEAVYRVGFDQVYELVLNAVSSQILIRPLTVYNLAADELWRMSVTCAIAAEILSKRIHLESDIAYTVGLFHGIGLVAIDEWAYLRQPDLRFNSSTLPLESCEQERKVLGFHNGEVGAALLRLWDFPTVMSEPLHWQYLPRGTSAHLPLSGMLHVAKWLRTAVCTNTTEIPLPEASLLQALNLSGSQLKELIEAVASRLTAVNSLLEIDNPKNSAPALPEGETSATVSVSENNRNLIEID
jgi:HD-like signal output (HDOD) protein